jgi:hypothetical protein
MVRNARYRKPNPTLLRSEAYTAHQFNLGQQSLPVLFQSLDRLMLEKLEAIDRIGAIHLYLLAQSRENRIESARHVSLSHHLEKCPESRR